MWKRVQALIANANLVLVGSIAAAVCLLLLMAIRPSLIGWAWIGSVELGVQVRIYDADSRQPIPGASLLLFNGPLTPDQRIEFWSPEEFSRQTSEPDAQSAETDAEGTAILQRRFRASGTSGWFRETGSIRTSGHWVRVSAPGYGTVLVPLDGQSGLSRTLKQRTPIFVTLLLGRQNSGIPDTVAPQARGDSEKSR